LSATTPITDLLGADGRPYFLWDVPDMDLDGFRTALGDPDPEMRAYWVGKLMRQAKPEDVFLFVTRAEIQELWPRLERYLGKGREFWTWLFAQWERLGVVS